MTSDRISSDTKQACNRLQLSTQTLGLATSATLAINEIVAQKRADGQEVLHLGFGQSSFPLCPQLRRSLIRSAGQTDYTSVQGIPRLRKSIAGYLKRTRNLSVSSEEIVVGPGSKPLLYALLQVLDGDLLLPTPSWVSYAPQALLAGKRVFGVETDPEDRLTLTVAAMDHALAKARKMGGNPRIMIVNSPNNPTGSMFDASTVEQIANWSRDNGIVLISDEIYAEVAHGEQKHVSPATFYPQGCIVTGGISKAFSAGGWRLGYAALPCGEYASRLKRALLAVASEIWSSPATPIQQAAIAAFEPNCNIDSYISACSYLHGELANRLQRSFIQSGIKCPRPAGAFYLYPDFEFLREALLQKSVRTSEELSLHLLDKWNIATLPGSCFGDSSERLTLRVSTSMLLNDASTGRMSFDWQETFWGMVKRARPGVEFAPLSSPPQLEQAEEKFREFCRNC